MIKFFIFGSSAAARQTWKVIYYNFKKSLDDHVRNKL